jgi:hypothetical protein
MPPVGFELTSSAFVRAKIVHVSDGAATVISTPQVRTKWKDSTQTDVRQSVKM